MRPFKFRVWNKFINNFDDGFVIDCTGRLYFRTSTGSEWCETMNKPTKEMMSDLEFTQFTCLLDCDGKEIYEGDILRSKYSSDNTYLYIVVWNHNDYSLDGVMLLSLKEPKSKVFTGTINDWNNDNLKIIGNKFENPELLENGDDI